MSALAEEVESSRWLVSLAGAEDTRVVGGKALPLAKAIAAGYAVPEAFVIVAGAADVGRDAVAAAVSEELDALGPGPYAVRSSAVAEDGRLRSMAGQLETRLNVAKGDVLDAVETCWASSRALRAVRYGAAIGDVAVIVQRMVAADAAGVAFSADPQTGVRDVCLIEAVPSLGDELVSGRASPESWRVTAGGGERESVQCVRRRNDAVLSAEQTRRIADLAVEMEELHGCPQDIEWALAGDELWLLQSRPITALPAAPIPIPVEVPEGGWDRDDHHGVVSPLMWSWFHQSYPVALAAAFRECGAPIEKMEATRVGGHLYVRMVMQGGESQKLPPRWALWLATRLVPGFRRGNRVAEAFVDQEKYMEVRDAWLGGDRAALRAELKSIYVADPTSLDDDELLGRLERAMALAIAAISKHAFLHGPFVFGVGKLALFLEDEVGWDRGRVFDLIAGSSSSTTQLHRELEAIVRNHCDELDARDRFPETWSALLRACPALGRALLTWLEDNGLRMMHYDPKHPTLGERPAYVLSIVENIAHGPAHTSHVDQRAADAVVEEAAALLSEDRAAELRRLVGLARSGYATREENAIDAVSKPAGLLRHFALELGRRLEPVIGDREFAVYLYAEEHGPALRGEMSNIRALIEQRRGEESWALQNRGPKRIGPPKPPMPPADVFPRGMSRLMRIIGWMEECEALPDPSDADAEQLRGVGIGTRTVTATARIVNHPDEMVRVRAGEIVVCRITSPEWSVGLGRVAALVTDEGGALSHPAIVAREFGVPAVLGTATATAQIVTGDTITVDPITGVVTLDMSHPRRSAS